MSVSESEFYMWRTLFAVAHADDVVSTEEIRFMAEALEDNPFSEVQKSILTEDIKNAQDPAEMFKKIGETKDQAKFFQLVRDLVWVDGEFDGDEQKILTELIGEHVKTVDFESLIGEVDLELDD